MYTMYARDQYKEKPGVGYVRVFHTVPDAPSVDVYANDMLVVDNLSFGDYTDYLTVPEGSYKISLYVAGTKENPVLTNMLMVRKDMMLTVAAVGTIDEIKFLAISDINKTEMPGMAEIRFMHLSPDAPAVDITLPDGTVIFKNVSFGQITPYISVEPMNYTLQARVAGTDTVALTVPDVDVQEDMAYTAYAIGLLNMEPTLEVLLMMDGQ